MSDNKFDIYDFEYLPEKYLMKFKRVVIPSEVTQIRNCAFKDCISLEKIVIPKGLHYIENCAFENCKNLKNIEILSERITIERYAFEGCLSIIYNEFKNGLYLGNKKNPYYVLVNVKDSTMNSYEIHKDTEFFANGAFDDCNNIINFKFPSNFTATFTEMFRGCHGLKNIDIPKHIEHIGFATFKSCTGLTSIVIPNSVISIGYEAFAYCSNLKNVEISNRITEIGNSTFSNCTSLTKINIPDSVKQIYSGAFEGCSNLKEINLPKGLTYIGGETFKNCVNLESIILPKLEEIKQKTFENCKFLHKVILQDGLKIIETNAFLNCESLEILEIPKSVKEIGKDTFKGCIKLNLKYYSSWEIKINESDINSIFAPNILLNKIEKNKLKYALGFILNYKTYRGYISEENINLYKEYIDSNKVRFYEILDKCVYGYLIENKIFRLKDIDTLIEKANRKNQIEISAMLLDYKHNNFTKEERNEQLEIDLLKEKSVSLYDLNFLWEVKKLENGNYNIYNYKGLGKEIEIPYRVEDGFVEEFSLYYSCKGWLFESSLTDIIIPYGIKKVGNNALLHCTKLNNVNLPNSIVEIGKAAFSKCLSLTVIKIPNSVKKINESAFFNCINLTTVEIPSTVESIGVNAFSRCENLIFNEYENGLYLGNSDNLYHALIDMKDSEVKKLVIHKDAKVIVNDFFDRHYHLENIEILSDEVYIYNQVLKFCKNLKYNEYENGLYLGDSDNPYNILSKVKNRCITSFVVHSDTKVISEDAFLKCMRLKNITIPASVKFLSKKTFVDCSKDLILKVESGSYAENFAKENMFNYEII